MTKMRDKYLHTNCLAALANMSSKFHSFHPYVAEKVLNLFVTIVKKYSKMRNSLLGVGGGVPAPDNTVQYWVICLVFVKTLTLHQPYTFNKNILRKAEMVKFPSP